MSDEVLEVLVVEGGGSLEVQRRQVVVAAGRRAALPALRREAGIDVGVVVDVGAEADAPRQADGVAARQHRHVPSVQVLVGEG